MDGGRAVRCMARGLEASARRRDSGRRGGVVIRGGGVGCRRGVVACKAGEASVPAQGSRLGKAAVGGEGLGHEELEGLGLPGREVGAQRECLQARAGVLPQAV